MANINDLNLPEDEQVVETVENLPQQFGSWVPPLQPGTYVFTLPSSGVLAEAFTTVDTTEAGSAVRRIKVDFSGAAKLGVLGRDGGYETSITSKRVDRGDGVLVSDLTYLLLALGHKEQIEGQRAYAEALMKYAGKSFQADVTWRATCDPNREVYKEVTGPDGPETKKIAGTKGCGTVFRTSAGTSKKTKKSWGAIPREEGKLVDRFPCVCGASLRAFTSLQNFQPYGG